MKRDDGVTSTVVSPSARRAVVIVLVGDHGPVLSDGFWMMSAEKSNDDLSFTLVAVMMQYAELAGYAPFVSVTHCWPLHGAIALWVSPVTAPTSRPVTSK